ncbi:MAG: dTMP kinase [Flavobacteriaceae bacterium]
MTAGSFITFEGGEGTGKSTQAARLAKYLRREGHDVVLTREPGGTPSGEIIRRIVLSGGAEPLGAFAEAVLMNAARSDHLDQIIRPALAAGKTVICDRFADSTRAYQGALGGLEDELLSAMERAVVGDTTPDLTFLLDAPVEITLARARRSSRKAGAGALGDRFEKEKASAHRTLRKAFRDIAARDKDRVAVIDARGTEAEVSRRILDVWNRRLGVAA